MDAEQQSAVRSKATKERGKTISYGIDENPPWYFCILMALQHYLTMIGAIVSIPFILTPALCMRDEDPARGTIISTMIFVTGLITYLQATWGCRLPLVQGGTISFLVPTLAILSLPRWKCPSAELVDSMSDTERTELWQVRMRELSGAIAVAAVSQIVLGFTGLVGKLLRIITPLTIAPTVALVGITLFRHASETASKHWGIAVGTTAMLTLFSQLLSNVNCPAILYRKGQGFRVTWFPLFKLFPVLLTIGIMWGLCAVLTATGVFPEGHPARTDVRLRVLQDAAWFRIPYPGQFGLPTVSLAGVLGMLAGVIACTIESISYYPTIAQMCGAPPPPLHAINRGIGIEGFGTVLAGLWGSGNGTNTFGENVGAIGVTRVGSRRVIQWAAAIMIVQGVLSKFGAIFIMIPDPVVGGIFCVMFGMIIAFGLGALQYVDLRSARNLYILGVSLFFPLVLCLWLQDHPGAIQTGNETVDSTLSVLLGTTILVGGALGCLLDNLIPGTDEERGLVAWSKEMALDAGQPVNANSHHPTDGAKCPYDFPYGSGLLRRWKWTRYVPFLPTYKIKL
ncbi:solute carrier family 23 member 2 [Anopheles darlingi]|uniref:Solute carrier family 23 member 2 n=1 Tax=Anopheles darlingi TaxID=43151 RepID=W5JVS4_ANODA|nr:solute carrier family 23 member 2 [Anopheles darlingi]